MAEEMTNAGPGAQEKPTLPVEEKAGGVEGKRDLNTVLQQLNIKAPEDLEGIVTELQTYKKGYGDSRNEVGDLRRKVEELSGQVSESNRRFRQPPPQTDPWSDQGETKSPPIDLETAIEKGVEKTYFKIQKQQQDAMDNYYRQRSEIEARPSWNRLGTVFDKALKDPAVARAIQTGNMTLDGLYQRLENRDLVNTVNELLTQIPKGALKPTPEQGTETADRTQIPLNAQAERKRKLDVAKEKHDVDGVIKNMFAENDPFFRK